MTYQDLLPMLFFSLGIALVFYFQSRLFLMLGKRFLYETWFHTTILKWSYRILAILTLISVIVTGLHHTETVQLIPLSELQSIVLSFLFLTYAILMLFLPQQWIRESVPGFSITRKETALPDRLMKRIEKQFQTKAFQEKERKVKGSLIKMSLVLCILLLSLL